MKEMLSAILARTTKQEVWISKGGRVVDVRLEGTYLRLRYIANHGVWNEPQDKLTVYILADNVPTEMHAAAEYVGTIYDPEPSLQYPHFMGHSVFVQYHFDDPHGK